MFPLKKKYPRLFWTSIIGVLLAAAISFFFVSENLFAAIPYGPIHGVKIEPPNVQSTEGVDAGTNQIVGIIRTITTLLKYFAGILAFVWAVWSGIRMVSAGSNEDQAKKSLDGVIYSVIALMLIVLVEPLILDTLYGGGGSFDPGKELVRENISKAISAGRLQVLAVIEWIKALTVFLGVAFLIFSAAQFMRDFGGEEQVGKQKTVLTWMAVGFIVIAVDQILIEEILYKAILGSANKVYFEQNPSRGILEAVGIMKYFLQFLAAIGFAMIIYGGVLMITNYASEENQEKGKKILITAGIGFLIIAMSYILVNSLATGKVL